MAVPFSNVIRNGCQNNPKFLANCTGYTLSNPRYNCAISASEKLRSISPLITTTLSNKVIIPS